MKPSSCGEDKSARTDSAGVRPEELFCVDRGGDDEIAQMEDHRRRVALGTGDHAHRVVERRPGAEGDGEQTVTPRRMQSARARPFAVILPVLDERAYRVRPERATRSLRMLDGTFDDSRCGTSRVDCSSNLTSTVMDVCSLGSPGLTCGVCCEWENTAGVNAFWSVSLKRERIETARQKELAEVGGDSETHRCRSAHGP